MKKTTANNKPAGNKRTLASLKTQPFKMPLIHPTEGDTGGYVELVSAQSNAYFYKVLELAKTNPDEASLETQIKASAELVATVIIGWDEEVFGQEYSTEAAVDLLSNVENFWIRDAINKALEDNSNFFPKA